MKTLRWRRPAALMVAMLVAGGCGSTRSERELAEAEARTGGSTPSPSVVGATPEGEAQSMPVAPAEIANGAASSVAGAPPGAKTRTDPGASRATAATPGESAGTGKATPGSGAVPGSGRASAVPGGSAAPVTGPKPEIALGVIGTMSGVIGQGVSPIFDAAKAWAGFVNARSGLQGHRVRLVFGDEGGDPSRALALAKRMAEQDRVAAFYAHAMIVTLQAVVPYLEEKKIPLLGGCNCSPPSTASPMVFEVGAGPNMGIASAFVLPLVGYSQERKASLIYCRDTASCHSGAENMRNLAKQVGIQIVHEAQVSFAQPDHTAEVLAARNAGAKAIIAFLDNPSVIRVKRAAARQGWHPLISAGWSTNDERFVRDGGQDAEGVVIGSPVATWESPRMADYVAAMSRHVPGGIKAGIGLPVWAAGKLMERIAPSFPDGPVARADFLRGLYTVKDETLGGIVAPVTFREGQPTPETTCVVLTRVERGRFIPRDGDNYFCPPPQR